ncbi:MAG: hypothetical protein ACXVRZ_03635 [Gaiellaceae bacterium]
MASISHEPLPAPPRVASWLEAVDMWSAIAIVVIWIAVIATAAFAPDMHFANEAGTQMTDIPSVVPVALIALFATSGIAKYGFGRRA